MKAAILLDAEPLGILAHPRNPPPAAVCRQWLADLRIAGRRIIVPEIADYEVRRELLRIGSKNGIINLNQLGVQLEYLPLTTSAIRKAAELWAQARNAGKPTAPDAALDCDVVLAAQALDLNTAVLVATGNAAHLSRYVPADDWRNIAP